MQHPSALHCRTKITVTRNTSESKLQLSKCVSPVSPLYPPGCLTAYRRNLNYYWPGPEPRCIDGAVQRCTAPGGVQCSGRNKPTLLWAPGHWSHPDQWRCYNSLHCEAISQSAAILSVMLNLRRDPCYGHIEISTFHVLFSCVLRGLVIP